MNEKAFVKLPTFGREVRKRDRHPKIQLPDQGVTRVQIDHKTEIWIKEGQDPEERKDAFLKRLDRFRNQPDHM